MATHVRGSLAHLVWGAVAALSAEAIYRLTGTAPLRAGPRAKPSALRDDPRPRDGAARGGVDAFKGGALGRRQLGWRCLARRGSGQKPAGVDCSADHARADPALREGTGWARRWKRMLKEGRCVSIGGVW